MKQQLQKQQQLRYVYQVFKTGKYETMKKIKQTISDPQENEIQVQVKSIGLNFADIFALMGLYSATPETPFIPGLEFSGVIQKLGQNIDPQFSVGDKVFGVTRFGGYSTIINANYNYIKKLPQDWTFEEGASFPCQTLTAYYGLIELGNLKQNHKVLIHSGAGGVGLQANKIAKNMGAYTIGTVGTENKLELLKQQKYDEQILRNENWHKQLKEFPDIVMDATGNKVMKQSYDLMNKQGRLIVYGGADFTPKKNLSYLSLAIPYLTRPKIDPLEMISDNKSIMGFNLIWLWEKTELMGEMLDKLKDIQELKPLVGKTFKFKDLKKAMQYLQSGKSVGKVVVNVDTDDLIINKPNL